MSHRKYDITIKWGIYSYIIITLLFSTLLYHNSRKIVNKDKYGNIDTLQYLIGEIEKNLNNYDSYIVKRLRDTQAPDCFELVETKDLLGNGGKLFVYEHFLRMMTNPGGAVYYYYKVYKSDNTIIVTNPTNNYSLNFSSYNKLMEAECKDINIDETNLLHWVSLYIYLTFEPKGGMNPIFIKNRKDITLIKEQRNRFFWCSDESDVWLKEWEVYPKFNAISHYYWIKCVVFSPKRCSYYRYEIIMDKKGKIIYVKRELVCIS